MRPASLLAILCWALLAISRMIALSCLSVSLVVKVAVMKTIDFDRIGITVSATPETAGQTAAMTAERVMQQLVTLRCGLWECLGLLGSEPNVTVALQSCWICCVLLA